jgi:hypothetical protein
VLGQRADKPISAKDQGERFQYGAFACAIGSDKYRLPFAELDQRTLDSAEILDAKLSNPHIPSVLVSRCHSAPVQTKVYLHIVALCESLFLYGNAPLLD